MEMGRDCSADECRTHHFVPLQYGVYYLYYKNNDYCHIFFFLSFFNIVLVYKTLLSNINEQNCISFILNLFFQDKLKQLKHDELLNKFMLSI